MVVVWIYVVGQLPGPSRSTRPPPRPPQIPRPSVLQPSASIAGYSHTRLYNLSLILLLKYPPQRDSLDLS